MRINKSPLTSSLLKSWKISLCTSTVHLILQLFTVWNEDLKHMVTLYSTAHGFRTLRISIIEKQPSADQRQYQYQGFKNESTIKKTLKNKGIDKIHKQNNPIRWDTIAYNQMITSSTSFWTLILVAFLWIKTDTSIIIFLSVVGRVVITKEKSEYIIVEDNRRTSIVYKYIIKRSWWRYFFLHCSNCATCLVLFYYLAATLYNSALWHVPI